MKQFNNIETKNHVLEKTIKVELENVNIEIFKGINKNGKILIQNLKPIETLKKRKNNLNGISFNTIQEAIVIIQSEEKRLNNEKYFQQLDNKLLELRKRLNYRKENYKWYNFF